MSSIVREKKYLNKRVYFLSYLDKTKYNYLSSLDYFIMLSENENFGNVYLNFWCQELRLLQVNLHHSKM